MVNLAISDFLIFLCQGPMMFVNAFSSPFWMFGSVACKIYAYLGAVFGKSKTQYPTITYMPVFPFQGPFQSLHFWQ